MSFDWDNIGKRLKAGVDVRVFERFPGSSEFYTLPAGKPSKKITGFIIQGGVPYIQLNDVDYVEQTELIEIVPENAPDDSSFFNTVANGVKDRFEDVETSVKYTSKNLGDSFKATIDKGLFENFNMLGLGWVNYILIGVPVVLVVYIFFIIYLKLK